MICKKNYISICKVISIIFVILIHIISKIYSSCDITSSNFNLITFLDVISRFCVPIFVMASGSIFLNRDDSPKKMIFKYALKIYIIFVISNFIYKYIYYQVLSGNAFNFPHIFNDLLSSLSLQSIFQLWYLRVILILYLLTPLIKLLRFNIKVDTIILIILFILSILIKNYFLTTLIGYIFYYYAGYYFDKYDIKKYKYIFYILGLISIIYSYNMSISSSIKLNTPSLVYIDYLSYNIMIYSVSLFIFIKNISTKLNNKTLDIFNKLSRYVFGIYLVHGIIIGGLDYVNIINLYDTNINIFTIILNTLITLIISFIIVYIFYKIKDNRIKNI